MANEHLKQRILGIIVSHPSVIKYPSGWADRMAEDIAAIVDLPRIKKDRELEAAESREQVYIKLMEANSPYTLQSKVADVVLDMLEAAELRGKDRVVQEMRDFVKRSREENAHGHE